MKTSAEKAVARLTYLRTMLVKYTQAYYRAIDSGAEPSTRIYSWIDEYNELRDKHYHDDAWKQYCAAHGSDTRHDAGDLMA